MGATTQHHVNAMGMMFLKQSRHEAEGYVSLLSEDVN